MSICQAFAQAEGLKCCLFRSPPLASLMVELTQSIPNVRELKGVTRVASVRHHQFFKERRRCFQNRHGLGLAANLAGDESQTVVTPGSALGQLRIVRTLVK